ncbi:MAG: LacI family transcriptional regulator [Candidatus Omnitrophica bacterium]|nr:LacI family transcriptional regulator [Candidatus Omnitrophota bacterium]
MVRTKKNNSGSISIEDVARVSGVSVTTVSRVINKHPSVKAKNRAKVLNAIKQLNFRPSIFAQRLATGRSNVVALVIPRYEGIFYSFYALELLRGIGTLCSALKLDLLLHLTEAHSPLNIRGVGGIIFADIIGNRSQLDEVMTSGTPAVVINDYIEEPALSCVAIDNAGGAEEAVSYLLRLGHRRIAHISGDLVTQAAAWRLEGYKRALQKMDVPVDQELILKTDYSRGQARFAAEKLFGMSEEVTAVFVASDSMALEVMAVAREMGKNIPQDISIVGFDDNPSGLYGPIALTTVRQPLIKMAEEGVKELSRLMNLQKKNQSDCDAPRAEDTKRILLPTELVIRESCRPLPSA